MTLDLAPVVPTELTDDQLAKIAYEGYDGYWTEDCKGIESEAWAASARAVLAAAPQQGPMTEEEIAYPRDTFHALLAGNSPYAFYLFQWVPYQTDAKRWRLKMQHDVRTFDGREAFNIWPNGSSCGPFRDDEVEFIRISKSQFGESWQDPRPDPPGIKQQASDEGGGG